MTTSELIERIDYQLHRVNKKRSEMLKDLDFPSNTISNWIARDTLPSIDKIAKMSFYFGVTIDEFLNMDKPKIDDDIMYAISKLMTLTEEQRKPIIAIISSQVDYWKSVYNKK